jgi:hypothetical protein
VLTGGVMLGGAKERTSNFRKANNASISQQPTFGNWRAVRV